ncbi:energy transducer TonB [Erythrobacter sp. SN021]|uniref:energy transducer TonB n=1 Tax=Erythrobacter sp. SN021 TaxID=2912574 RepID=UPI001F1E5693|nr:energy transducer TonB [Erythrobacter sp. SN021]MCF8883112.1 energy transducer TonB [Erythrobacter sp. SN021]
MAYADQQMSGNRIVAIIIVALIHVALGYALITGLAYNAVQQVVERVTTIDIEEPPPPEEEPPPPPPENVPDTPPPPVAPPPPPSKARSATPKGQNGWARRIQSNYPRRAEREGTEGSVGVTVQIGANGRVSSCSVTRSSGSSDLDSAACDGMTRYARFNPAQDAAGNAISDTWSTTIVYQLN